MSTSTVEAASSRTLSLSSHRWLKSFELFAILSHPASYSLSFSPHPPLFSPQSGSLYLYDKRQCRRWRYDHHDWQTPERHVKLKLDGRQCINAIYSRSRQEAGLTRRGYWLLDRSNVVLVHYLNVDAAARQEGVKKETGQCDERKESEDERLQDDGSSGGAASIAPMQLSPYTQPGSLRHSDAAFLPSSFASALPPLRSSNSALPTLPSSASSTGPSLLELSPSWDHQCGGSKVIVCCSQAELFSPQSLCCLFGSHPVPVDVVMPGVYRAAAPSLPAHLLQQQQSTASVAVCLSDGKLRSSALTFQYRKGREHDAAGSAGSERGGSALSLPWLSSPPLSVRRTLSRQQSSGSALTSPLRGGFGVSPPSWSSSGPLQSQRSSQQQQRRVFLSCLLSLLVAIERALLLSSSSSLSLQSTFTLEELQQVVAAHPSDDLLEGLMMFVLQSALPSTAPSSSSTPTAATSSPRLTSTSSPLSASLSASKSLSQSDSGGCQLIHYATALDLVHVVALLLDAGCSLEAADEDGRTPLHWATQYGDEQTVAALLAFGADVDRKDRTGRRAVDIAREMGRGSIVSLFGRVEAVEAVEQEEEEGDDSHRLWQWEDDDEDEVELGQHLHAHDSDGERGAPPFLSQQPLQLHDYAPQSVLPFTAALTPSSLPLSTPSSPSHSAVLNPLSLSSGPPQPVEQAFAGLTLADIGINTEQLHLASLTPNTPHFHAVVAETQRQLRAFLYRRHYAALKLQAAARGMLVRRSLKRLRESTVLIQQWTRRRRKEQRVRGKFEGIVMQLRDKVRRKRELASRGDDEGAGQEAEQATAGDREREAGDDALSGADAAGAGSSALPGDGDVSGVSSPLLDPFDDGHDAPLQPLSPISSTSIEQHLHDL